jgi:hypothetical protein
MLVDRNTIRSLAIPNLKAITMAKNVIIVKQWVPSFDQRYVG